MPTEAAPYPQRTLTGYRLLGRWGLTSKPRRARWPSSQGCPLRRAFYDPLGTGPGKRCWGNKGTPETLPEA